MSLKNRINLVNHLRNGEVKEAKTRNGQELESAWTRGVLQKSGIKTGRIKDGQGDRYAVICSKDEIVIERVDLEPSQIQSRLLFVV